jgi:uncharacterized protein YjbI with pentapeptide repeats
MNERGQTIALEVDVPQSDNPVNPYSLLGAVNEAADTVHTGWLLFLGVMSYLLITSAGVTHKDLLLNNEIPLPILQVKIDLSRFFFFAPIILVLFHTGLIAQLVLLARKTLEFDRALRLLEATDSRDHPLRLEISNFFFVQAIAGPERSRVMSAFLHGMSWLTIVLLPVLILLYMQIVFLPYHGWKITAANRTALFADILVLATIGTFLARSERNFFAAFASTLRKHPLTALATVIVIVPVMLFSLFVATIPGERLDRITDLIRGRGQADATKPEPGYFGFAVPFLKPKEDGSLFGLFYRNLVVTDMDLVQDNLVTPGEPTLNLRGRDLRYARLNRTDMHQADFTGADLEGASFVQADLRNVIMSCADIDRLLLGDKRRDVGCTDARGANFTRARLTDARLAGGDFGGAVFDHATLDGGDLRYTNLADADFTAASLLRADLSGGVVLHGANLLTASLAGADFTSAELTMATLLASQAQGAVFAHAKLEGARLQDADLEGADFQNARLIGADLTGARAASADFRGASIWFTRGPDGDALLDAAPLTVRAPDALDLTGLKDIIARAESPALRRRLEEGLSPLLTGRDNASWSTSPEGAKWAALQNQSTASTDGFKQRLTDQLVRIACRATNANAAAAVGIAKRTLRPTFKGDLAAYYQRIKNGDCPAARNLPVRFLTDYGQAVDIARGQ